MDYQDYNVFYLDSRMSPGLDGKRIVKTEAEAAKTVPERSKRISFLKPSRAPPAGSAESLKAILGEIEEVRSNIKQLLHHFHQVRTCVSRKTCLNDLHHIERTGPEQKPTLVFATTTFKAEDEVRSAQAASLSASPSSVNLEGLALVQEISSEVVKESLSLVFPAAILYGSDKPTNSDSIPDAERQAIMKLVDAGALDVSIGQLHSGQIRSLIIRAYSSHQESARRYEKDMANRKWRRRSWLGDAESQPYAYLREKMVSDLMRCICDPNEDLRQPDNKPLSTLDAAREAHLRQVIGTWAYSGHQYTEDELIHAASFMIEHAFTVPELEKWQLPKAKLQRFLIASRSAYNDFVDYHNFRHVIDVMQAIFYFLVQLGVLPEYPPAASSTPLKADTKKPKTSLATLLTPMDALTLLITAIGHDVGHPGVNNAFLVALNAPLAQLYNDRSVLEAFHCAAYSQILRRYWRSAFQDKGMRSLMINSILATDMGVHGKYMTDMGNLQDKVDHELSVENLTSTQRDEYRSLLCALLIKCADISNVARPYSVAVRWAEILQVEFANQGIMEEEVGIPTTLFGGPPELGNLVKLGQSQNGFMNFFARPLFENVAHLLPSMNFAVTEISANQKIWADRIKEAMEDEARLSDPRRDDPMLSPRSPDTGPSFASPPRQGHPEGLPASGPRTGLLEGIARSPQTPSGDPAKEAVPSSYFTGVHVSPKPHDPNAPSPNTSSQPNFSYPNKSASPITTQQDASTGATRQRSQTMSSEQSRQSVDTLSQLQFGNLSGTNGGGKQNSSASASDASKSKAAKTNGMPSGDASLAIDNGGTDTAHAQPRRVSVVNGMGKNGVATSVQQPPGFGKPYTPPNLDAKDSNVVSIQPKNGGSGQSDSQHHQRHESSLEPRGSADSSTTATGGASTRSVPRKKSSKFNISTIWKRKSRAVGATSGGDTSGTEVSVE